MGKSHRRNANKSAKRTKRNRGTKQTGGTGEIIVFSLNCLARAATQFSAAKHRDYYHPNYKTTNPITYNTNVTMSVDDIVFQQGRQPSIGVHRGECHEHIEQTYIRFFEIQKRIIESKADVVLLQEVDNYLFTYLMKKFNPNGTKLYDGYYKLPPLHKPTPDLAREFGTAILWKPSKFTAVKKLPIDYITHARYTYLNPKSSDQGKDLLEELDYPDYLGVNTAETFYKKEDGNWIPKGYEWIQKIKDIKPPNNKADKSEADKSEAEKAEAEKAKAEAEAEAEKAKAKAEAEGLYYKFTDNKGNLSSVFGMKIATFVQLQSISEKKTYDFVSLHLPGNSKKVNVLNTESQNMLEFIKHILDKSNNDIQIVGGDFNCDKIKGGNTGFAYIKNAFGGLTPIEYEGFSTYSYDYAGEGNDTTAQIDHIFYKGVVQSQQKITVTELKIGDKNDDSHEVYSSNPTDTYADVLYASDHSALIATFQI